MILFVCCEVEPCADAMEDFLGSLGRVALVETHELVLEDLMLALRDDFLFPGHKKHMLVKPQSFLDTTNTRLLNSVFTRHNKHTCFLNLNLSWTKQTHMLLKLQSFLDTTNTHAT